ncbi:aldo/keto reductase [candidate division MSBL1 archaeon SCGC-AAA259E19]|uniref:Aldo/keto reductase n=1 Tax=candidate division MSBL1 archaeon SCGC-AAA259E19 TaxID=1698264 RepID=A0A133UMU7_9EURY|nr:aldo/keto reductase [candidate division MSBL1 archaeon SCGC-AAA259E19]
MIPKKNFGRTEHRSSRTIFGGAALWSVSQEEADQVLRILKEYGVNHIDTASSYGDSEIRIGPWMEEHRQDFFLATKTGERTYEGAKDQIRQSLERLNVDQIDLLQIHNLVDPEEWKTTFFRENGALEAIIEAREEGLVRYIGVTGHGLNAPEMHQKSLKEFDFDSVLLPFNYPLMQNPEYAESFWSLIGLCKERNVGVQTIKSIARGRWGDEKQTRNTWYRPLEDQEEVDKAVHWMLSHPYFFLNTVADPDLLPKVLDSASRFQEAPSEKEMKDQMEDLSMEPLWPE